MVYKANKAIIMAAGKGERMKPLTLTTPKPMIKVHGKRMIDTVIDALYSHGIYEIYVVVGHLKEKFIELKKDYPRIELVENPYYNHCNNISSLYVVKEHLGNTIILDGDQIIYNKEILNPVFERSGYCCTYSKEYTNEWLLTLEEDIVVNCQIDGGKDAWQLYSVSFWNEEDGKRLKELLEFEFDIQKNRDVYWDNVALLLHPDKFELGIRKINKNDLIEIDSFEELSQLDSFYAK